MLGTLEAHRLGLTTVGKVANSYKKDFKVAAEYGCSINHINSVSTRIDSLGRTMTTSIKSEVTCTV